MLISCGIVPRGSSSHRFSISFGGSKPSFGRSILSFGGSKPSFGGSKRSEIFRTAPCKAYSARRAQVLQSTYGARRHQQPTFYAARPVWPLENRVGRHYIYSTSRSDTGQWREAVGRCALPFAKEAFTIGRA